MKHNRGINLVGDGGASGYTVGEGSRRSSGGSEDKSYRIEVWTDEPEAGGSLVETISRATDFEVSCAALRAATRQRPGKVLIHLNGKYRMTCARAPDPPSPLFLGRPGGGLGRTDQSGSRQDHLRNSGGMVGSGCQVSVMRTQGLA